MILGRQHHVCAVCPLPSSLTEHVIPEQDRYSHVAETSTTCAPPTLGKQTDVLLLSPLLVSLQALLFVSRGKKLLPTGVHVHKQVICYRHKKLSRCCYFAQVRHPVPSNLKALSSDSVQEYSPPHLSVGPSLSFSLYLHFPICAKLNFIAMFPFSGKCCSLPCIPPSATEL